MGARGEHGDLDVSFSLYLHSDTPIYKSGLRFIILYFALGPFSVELCYC